MSTTASAEEHVSQLKALSEKMSALFPKNTGRLEQLNSHLQTAAMVVEHLFDEQARADHDKAERVRKAQEEE
jgi:hypothetical protein